MISMTPGDENDESKEHPPSRFDIGKEKFGGPFQNRTIEDVKAFLAIGCILLTLGPTLATEFAASELLHISDITLT